MDLSHRKLGYALGGRVDATLDAEVRANGYGFVVNQLDGLVSGGVYDAVGDAVREAVRDESGVADCDPVIEGESE